ncbi:MAG: hypothetical protein J0H86_00070 [Xanthomonadaceae bacterium]|nr:hypothetical protein [Xanthomonadaceae bacterium]
MDVIESAVGAQAGMNIDLRAGHAVLSHSQSDDGDLVLALDVAAGNVELLPRTPREEEIVTKAEKLLSTRRPIYAYVGFLHPELGTVGLIVAPGWARRSLFVAVRCDSGGLIGGYGGFKCVGEKCEEMLLEVAFRDEDLPNWSGEFQAEVKASYEGNAFNYVSGQTPNFEAWKDIRVECIRYAIDQGEMDRRLWSWELWLQDGPSPAEIEAIVLSPENCKRMERLVRSKPEVIPRNLRIIYGKVDASGVWWLNDPAVHNAFLGA